MIGAVGARKEKMKMNYDFLYDMIQTESVSGGEIPLQKKVAAHMQGQGCTVQTDYTGNVIASINEKSPLKVLMTGHIDEIGFRVTYLTEKGMIKVGKAGFIRPELMQGKRVTILGKKRLTGVMGILLKDGQVRTDATLTEMYVDCGFRTGEEAAQWVTPGDFVTYTYAYDLMENNCIAGRGLDDKLGAFTVMQALLRARELGAKAGVYAGTTVGEETTMRGAYFAAAKVKPALAIAVDVIHTSDYPGSEAERFGKIELGGGPVLVRSASSNEPIVRALEAAAKKLDMAVQYEIACGVTGTDADKMHQSADGVPMAVVSIPLRYMHSPSEVGCLSDVENCVELLARFIADLDEHFSPDPFRE